MSRTLAVVDYKSGGIFWEAELQLGAYRKLLREGHTADGQVIGLEVEWGCLLQTNAKHTQPKVVLTPDQLAAAETAFDHFYAGYQYAVTRGHSPPASGRYRLGDRDYISVTEILRFAIAKPALLNWYKKMGAEGRDPQAYMEERGLVGSAIHHGIQEYLVTKVPPPPDDDGEIVQAVRHFCQWELTAELEPHQVQTTIFNDGVKLYHGALGFAGSPDFAGTLNHDVLTKEA